MKKTLTAVAVALTVITMSATAQADNFLIGLLQSATWQPPKCAAPLVLTQVFDRKGNIHFTCAKPANK